MKSKAPYLLLGGILASCSATRPPAGTPPLRTEAKVDLKRYSGKWFELARLPQWFQRDCASATADYTPKPDGGIQVVNTCILADGSERSITGSAMAVDEAANRLKVSFSDSWAAKFIPIPDDGNYWIIQVTPGYRQALVGTPDRKSLWILSRSPEVSRKTLEELKSLARNQGFDTSALVLDNHTRVTD